MDEKSLLSLYKAHDERAIEETMTCYGAHLRRLAIAILHDEGAADECVNDTCLKAWNTLYHIDPSHLSAYLCQICRNTAFAMLKTDAALKRQAQLVELTDEMALCLPDRTANEHVELWELGELLTRFLKAQPREHRIVFLRRYWFAESIEDIARHRNLSVSNVKTMLHRTRKKLKSYLEQEGVGI